MFNTLFKYSVSYFFFSSRRRHTISKRDWSSDVCSSDLNLYEVFVMLALMTALFYLYYERRYATRALGGFVLLVISSVVVFLLWYSFDRGAHEIQPVVPALKRWWMKLHVPANFIGYGTFALAAMVGFAYLVKENSETRSWGKLTPLFLLGVILCAEPFVFGSPELSMTWMLYFGLSVLI